MRVLLLRLVVLSVCSILLFRANVGAQSPFADGEHTAVLNGVRLWYKVAGTPHSGVAPLLYLPGGPGYNSYSFQKTIGPQLEPHLQVIYFDERGTGRSERPSSRDYSMTALTVDIEALRKELGLPQISVMGHSFGGTIALEYAAHYPERVQRLILVDGVSDYPEVMQFWETELKAREPEPWATAVATPAGKALAAAEANPQDTCALARARFAVIGQVFSQPEVAPFFHWQQFHDLRFQREQEALDEGSGLRNTGEISHAYLSPGNPALCYRFREYGRLTMPVLVITGRFDGAVDPRQAHALVSHLPNAREDVFDQSAHFPYAEEPAKFVQDLSDFLMRRPGTPKASPSRPPVQVR